MTLFYLNSIPIFVQYLRIIIIGHRILLSQRPPHVSMRYLLTASGRSANYQNALQKTDHGLTPSMGSLLAAPKQDGKKSLACQTNLGRPIEMSP